VVKGYQSIVPLGADPDGHTTSNVAHARCYGKGKTDRQAWASAFCEAIERYSALYSASTDMRRRFRYNELGDRAVHPNELLMFSASQYEHRESWNSRYNSERYWIPHQFDEHSEIGWTPAWSLTNHRMRYLPSACCLFGFPTDQRTRFCIPDSNGIAAGNNLEEAILQGLFEVIERDSVSLWWYNKAVRPSVDLSGIDGRFVEGLRSAYSEMGREFWVLDITADLGVPSFVAVSSRPDREQEYVTFGCGSHVDPRIAILRALTELGQVTVAADQADWEDDSAQTNIVMKQWVAEAKIADNAYLAPSPDVPEKSLADFPYEQLDDIRLDIENCVEILTRAGLETLVLDLTKPDVGMSVVRVAVPGLRPHARRLAPGRLYDIPIRVGWLQRPVHESDMNAVPMFI